MTLSEGRAGVMRGVRQLLPLNHVLRKRLIDDIELSARRVSDWFSARTLDSEIDLWPSIDKKKRLLRFAQIPQIDVVIVSRVHVAYQADNLGDS